MPETTQASGPLTLDDLGRWLARATAALALLALAGWQLDLPALRAIGQPVSMNPLTAILFLLCWLAIELLPRRPDAPARVPQLIGIALGSIALLKIQSYFGLRFSLDRLLYGPHLDTEILPNQMSPNTAIAFLLLGIKITILCTRPRLSSNLPQVLALITAYIGFQSLVAYCFGIGGTFEIGSIVPMALNTAAAMLSFSIALLLIDSQTGFVAELTRDYSGGAMARRLLPSAILLPIGIGWLRFQGQQRGLFPGEVGVTLMITAMVICLVGAIWWNARQLNRTDAHVHAILKDLERLNHELETFSYSVSHDLRAPLRAIAGFSHILNEEYAGALDAQGKDYLQRIGHASERMGKLIDGLLGLSRLSRKPIRFETVDLNAIAKSVIDELRSTDPGRNVSVRLQSRVTASGDPDLLAIVLQNLLGNAWKFSARVPDAIIEFGQTLTPTGEAYYVRDNGAGFDMQYARNLFGAFQRLHSVSEFEGTGIGLATVQRILHRHGGAIWAEAAPGQGATFYFTLGKTPAKGTLPTWQA